MALREEALSPEDWRSVIADLRRITNAEIAESLQDRPGNVKKYVFDLSTAPADPIQLAGPFKCLWVATASDNTAEISVMLHTKEDHARHHAFPLKLNGVIISGKPVGTGFVTWTAQTGKTLTMFLATDMEFRSGQMISVNSGGVAINEGSSVTSDAKGSVGTSAAVLLAADVDRKKTTIQNQGSTSIYVGGAGVTVPSGTNPGLEVSPGVSFEWRNTAALYAIGSVANSSIAILSEE